LRPFTLSVKVRLALMCGGLFLLSGTVLLGVNYLLVRATFPAAGAGAGVASGGPSEDLAGHTTGARLVGSAPEAGTVTVLKAVTDFRDEALDTLLAQSGFTLAGTLLLALVLGWITANRVLRPVHAVVEAARRLCADNLDQRIRLPGPRDELTELADTFDEMLDRLSASFDSQRRFVANASHELRTPLAAQRTLVEVAMARPAVDPAVHELGTRLLTMNVRLEALIEGLLVLARSDRGLAAREPVDFVDVVDAVGRTQRAAAERAGVDFRTTTEPAAETNAVVPGDRVLLERMVANLVDNAIKYNHRGGTVRLSTSAAVGQQVLWVYNTGPQVPAAETAGLFEPFRQIRRGRGVAEHGVGLGLSIVASIVRAHGGSVTAAPRPGGGLEVVVRLPVSPGSVGELAGEAELAE
jgi:signal transduction histidine kinase